MEKVQNYIKDIYERIDKLLVLSRELWLGYLDNVIPIEDIWSNQQEIARLHSLVLEAKERYAKQRCYIQLMVQSQHQLTDGRKTEGDYCFLTVNPPDQLPYEDLVRATETFVNLSVVKGASYVFEQRGKEIGDYRGFHTHILFERNVKPYAVKKELHRIFDPLVPQLPCINTRWISSKDDVKNMLKYMSGDKKDPNKSDAVLNNAHMRAERSLLSIYSVKSPLLVSDLPSCGKVCLIPEVD